MPRNLDNEIQQAKEALEALEVEKLEMTYEGVVGSTYKHERGDVFVVKSIAYEADVLDGVVAPVAIGVMKRDTTVPLSRLSNQAWTKK